MGILSTTKKKGIPVKKLTACLTLTLLFALSVSAATIQIQIYGNSITQYGSLPKTNIYVNFYGHTCNSDSSINNKDSTYTDSLDTLISGSKYTNPYKTLKKSFVRGGGSTTLWTGTVTIYRKGYIIKNKGDTTNDTMDVVIHHFSKLSTSGPSLNYIYAYEKAPIVTTNLFYSNSLLQWGVSDSSIIDSQSLWASYDQGATYKKRIDSLSPLISTQRSYPWSISPGTVIFKIKTTNADSSDSSFYTLSTTSIKNKIRANSTFQKTSTAIFNAQGRLIYKGVMDSRHLKFSTGKYITSNKTKLLLH